MQDIKQKKIIIFIMILVSSILNSYIAFSQEPIKPQIKDSIQIDKTRVVVEKIPWDKIEQFRKDKAFDYNFKLRTGLGLWSRLMYWLSDIFEAFYSAKGAVPLLRLVLRIIVIIGIVVIIYLIFKADISGIFSKNKKSKSVNDFDYFDEDIHNQDLDKNLSRALAEQNFRDAIRYYYLKLLKQLDVNELIQWKISKTNLDYQNELAKHPLLNDFKILSGIYEYTWYGKFAIDQTYFTNWQSDFQSAYRRINLH